MSTSPNIFNGLLLMLEAFFDLLRESGDIWSILERMWAALRRWICGPRRRPRRSCDVDIPGSEYKRPDPMLYSQSFLMAQGLAVTWDNPDIQLFDGGTAVSSYNLLPDHEYRVVVRIWNNATGAPAANLPVHLSYLDFGVGGAAVVVGKGYVDLGVKGSAHCPAFADFSWRTPPQAGHYCLQARLDWMDDANPDNNLGQENTTVGSMHSPAQFAFQVRNEAGIARRFRLEADMYRLPGREPCPPEQEARREEKALTRLAESRQRWKRVLEAQGYGNFPVPAEWDVRIDPQSFSLDADQQTQVQVEIEYRSGQFSGSQPFNIHCFAASEEGQWQLAGGVTLTVQGG